VRALVTGGAGFIGSALVDKLILRGHEVTVIDNHSARSNNKFYSNPKAYNYKLDICDYEGTRGLYKGIDCVFHLAAESRLQLAIENPIEAVEKNAVGTCTVLQCAREAGVDRVLYSSTSSAYGMNNSPSVETQPDDCLNPYSVSKVAGEKLCKMYTDLYGLKTIIFRYFNVFGDRSPTIGQYAPVIGVFQRQHAAGEPLTVVGTGKQRRDFIHVDDVVSANTVAASTNLSDDKYGMVYNVGSGDNISIIEIADIISERREFIPTRTGEVNSTLANIDRITSTFDWKPTIKTRDWVRSQ